METVLDRIRSQFQIRSKNEEANSKSAPLYQQIYRVLQKAIFRAEIPVGHLLPPSRVLAEALGVSRSTIVKAYELLRMEGFIESVQGSGHRVKQLLESFEPIQTIDVHNYRELSDTAKSFEKNIHLINSTDDKSVAFRPGLPPLDIFPVNQWKNLSNLYWRYIKSSALSYSPSSGIDQLKKNIAGYLNLSRKIKCDTNQIIIVSGSLQSLYLLGTVLLNPGDDLAMENPTFPNVYSIFKGLRGNIHGIPVDDQGIRVSDMETAAIKNSKFVHVTPSCHYPLGVRMSMKRRTEILDWASRNKAFIIENDYEHEVHNYKESVPSLFSLDREQRTIYLSTFNRLMHPSIRIGYMVLPPILINAVEALLKHSHRFVPPVTQVVLNSFIENKYLYPHVKRVVEVAEERKAIFTERFESHFGDRMYLQNSSVRSLHLLAKLRDTESESKIIQKLAARHIVVHAYSKCFVGDERQSGLIFGYSSVRSPVIRQKIEEMASAILK